jgi:hypothetical protein
MDKNQWAAAKLVEKLKTEGKISSMSAHSMNNAIVAGFETFQKQYPDVASQMTAPKSSVNKLKMPPPVQKEETE